MIIAVEGRKYEGKTMLALWLALTLRSQQRAYPVMIFDPKWSLRAHTVSVGGITRTIRFSENADELIDAIDAGGSDAITYRPMLDLERDGDDLIWNEFSVFCKSIGLADLLRNPPTRPVILLIDEAEYLQGGNKVHPALSSAIRLATSGKLFIILACHGPRELVPTVRRHVDDFYIFRLDDPADLDYVRQRCGQVVADSISKLPLHHFVHFASRSRESLLYNRPELWKVDDAQKSGNGSAAQAARSSDSPSVAA